ncbi:MAG: isoprenylcysteine carboxylmethyltransferase family protein [Candidatus Aminicenantaceae bacterium]
MHSPLIKNIIQRWRVRAGFLGIILVILLSKPNWISILSGFALCLLGLLIRTWAAGHLKKEKELTVSGPYRYTRNPLYLGNVIVGISVVIGSYSWWALTIFVVYVLLFYPSAVKREKYRMKELFPEKYEKYSEKVPLFFPTLKPKYPAEEKIFDFGLYKKNKEYRALVGAFFFWIILVEKSIFF